MAYTIEFFTADILAAVAQAQDEEAVLTALAIEGDAKAEAPVRGGYRSFRQGQPPIGGALRRSYTTAPAGQAGDPRGGGNAVRNVKDGAIDVGSWIGYAYYVDRGTTKMLARPHFSTAIVKNIPKRGQRFEQAFNRITNGRYR